MALSFMLLRHLQWLISSCKHVLYYITLLATGRRDQLLLEKTEVVGIKSDVKVSSHSPLFHTGTLATPPPAEVGC